MARIITAVFAGVFFGTGIALSGMGNPAKVLNFFDPAGTFDPSLILVMVSALAVTAIGYRAVFSRGSPLFALRFDLPSRRDIDLPLVAGSATFGIGWGIAGFCPGGAIPMLGLGSVEALVFVGSMLAGILAARTLRQRGVRTAAA